MYHQTIRKEINEKKKKIKSKKIKQQKRYYLKQKKRNANLILRSINSKETDLLKKI